MSNFLIKNNEIIIKFIGLIVILFVLDVIFDYYYTNIILKKLDDYLIYLGVKKKKTQEGMFPGPSSIAALPTTIMTSVVAMSILTMAILGGKWIVKLGISIGQAIYGGLFTAIFGSMEIALGIPHLIVFTIYLVRWLVDHIICTMQLLFSLPTCIFFYIFNTVGQLIYLPFRIIFFILWLCGVESIYNIEKQMWDSIEAADQWVFKHVIPVHFAHWPKSIRSKCFSCVRLKMGALGKKFIPVGDRFGKQLPRKVGPYAKIAGKGFMGIIDSFTKFP